MRTMKSMLVVALLSGCSAGPPDSKSNDTVVLITNADPGNNEVTCPVCDDGEACVDGFCQTEGCEPTCAGTSCGPNGCGGMCNPCEGRKQCVSGECELPPMDCSGFAEAPTEWSLPPLFVDEQFERIADVTANCGAQSGEIAHQLLDLTGDGLVDLVLSDRCDSAGVGTTRWDVHENTGTGFAATPTSWSLPALFVDEQFERTAGTTADCGAMGGEFSFQLVDLTGTGRLDLVLTDRCDGAGVGTTRWDVHENTGSGFADSPTAWTLPSLFVDEQFERLAATTADCGAQSGEISHQLLDLTGDGRPDLLLSDRCDSGGVGTTRWDVHENTGSGFATSPTSWSLPRVFVDEQFERLADTTANCGASAGEISHQVLDLTGDGRPDLVLTDRCDSGGVGTLRWDVHENTGSGFATDPVGWTIPALFVDEQFERIAGTSANCGASGGEISHQLLDMDADGLPDLLLTDKCDGGGVGTTRWEYYRNEGNGFAAAATSWTLPALFVDEQFERIAATSANCGALSGEISHSIIDLDGDGALDLVLTDRCDSGGVGTARWDLHRASCN